MTSPKRKAATAFQTTSFHPITSANPHTLILGTHPSVKSINEEGNLTPIEKKLRGNGYGGSMNYGHPYNQFWYIAASFLGDGKQRYDLPFEELQTKFTQGGFSLWDVVKVASKDSKGSLDCAIDYANAEYNDVLGFLRAKETVEKVVLAKTACEKFILKYNVEVNAALNDDMHDFEFVIDSHRKNVQTRSGALGKKLAKLKNVSVVDDVTSMRKNSSRRIIELVVLSSTSPAHATIRPYEKEEEWLRNAYNVPEGEAPPNYKCPCCGLVGRHLLLDCDRFGENVDLRMKNKANTENEEFESWRDEQMKCNRKIRSEWISWDADGRPGEEPSFEDYAWAV